MAVLTTKYSIGDTVYHASTAVETKQHPCPDCNGSRKWEATSPAGGVYSFPCPRCNTSFSAKDELSIKYAAHVPAVRRLTIGSVQYNTASGSWDSGARYMCTETGIGSANVYDENRLFSTEEEAMKAADGMARASNANIEWIATKYNRTLEISDYQLENAALKDAADEKRRAGSLLWNLSDLFDAIKNAETLEAVTEAVEEYQKWSWKSDVEAVRVASVDGSPQVEAGATSWPNAR